MFYSRPIELKSLTVGRVTSYDFDSNFAKSKIQVMIKEY